jgi:ECF sigma factor
VSDDSVSVWIDRLKAGDPAAARPRWDRYFDPLVRLVRGKLSQEAAA